MHTTMHSHCVVCQTQLVPNSFNDIATKPLQAEANLQSTLVRRTVAAAMMAVRGSIEVTGNSIGYYITGVLYTK